MYIITVQRVGKDYSYLLSFAALISSSVRTDVHI